MLELVQKIIEYLVDNPDKIEVKEVEGDTSTIIQVKVAQSDIGKVIGKQGRIIEAIRTLGKAIGGKSKRNYMIEMIEDTPRYSQ
ncbi:MAG: KH domain-containing protein [Thermodesulfobacteriota bacterium]|nr:KH domain-containing protein [Thermodesulfobacteriota bacterium]